ncbi:DNA mismatch repair endonuclease MutL [Lactobacillus sp. LC28-10]|uniref:DNA mismatch repair protein MutL n=1 Tax=Secundilactobacillus angelensis TaxID=2722706 RepID=A0ABX1L2B9_9LACO|nr:DNA mismatch repair endonuclease MutL [Secundilactobacillus angelensis]MCH5462048.1 DNA mismatch repair endonuclease MutL [Secundilactobacillus angelensis]NLR18471.1 DNA mismatch repair endonuclease MutL [Secundilactobacillus angelensis]
MSAIHELPAVLSNQISAGEVIERPASVVKELVENAIDAGSHEIDILVDEAGLKMIEVIDDGSGIEGNQLELAFHRHATSKIGDRKDLFKVNSLGFRGEALPSISSIADVEMVTSTGGEGQAIHISGGKLISQKPAEARRGTDVTVKDLFYNVPARLKYMKSLNTELSKIVDIVNRLALGHPQIQISLTHNNRELLRTAGRGDLRQVIGSIYGMNKAGKMLSIDASDADFKVSGYVSLPELTRASRSYMTILLNGRYIKNYELSKAIIEGYGSKLMVGRYPVAVLNLQMDPLLVDVNVHPTKQEVRISKESQLSGIITEAIRNRLSQQNLIPDGLTNLRRGHVDPQQVAQNLAAVSATREPQPSHQPISQSTTPQQDQLNEQQSGNSDGALFDQKPSDGAEKPIVIHSKDELSSPIVTAFEEKYQQPQTPFNEPMLGTAESKPTVKSQETELLNQQDRFPNLIYIGQFHGTYLLAQSDEGLYILDQHAAQERVNYEYYRQAIGEVSDDQQRLLVPIVLDYSTSDMLKITDQLDMLASVGLHLEQFGPNSFILHQHPTWFKAGQEADTVKEMIDWVLRDGHLTVAQFREKTAIMMSCKRAIKANHHLDDQQAKALIQHLKTAENPFNCPHGRPVLIHFTDTDMEKMFKRIQESHHSLRSEA